MKHLILLLALFATLSSCRHGRNFSHDEKNSVYYWKTVFAPDSSDFAFIHKYNIGCIYLRMFDVSVDNVSVVDGSKAVPNATVRIPEETYYMLNDSLGSIEFVPVVYITLDAMKDAKGYEGQLARNIVTRVKNMCSYNALPNVSGLQLDCDWTTSTEQSFFTLCDSVRYEIRKHDLPWNLSSTIRLHQLARQAPPVDYGVLMVYNTGNFSDPDAANSILDKKDIEPYLKHLSDFPLHLDVAYPTYSWQLLFRKRQFVGLLNGVNVQDTTKFKTIKNPHTYQCLEDVPYKEMIIRKGDEIRVEDSEYQDIMSVKAMIEQEIPSTRHSNILYHFDLCNFSKYTADEINRIFSHTEIK